MYCRTLLDNLLLPIMKAMVNYYKTIYSSKKRIDRKWFCRNFFMVAIPTLIANIVIYMIWASTLKHSGLFYWSMMVSWGFINIVALFFHFSNIIKRLRDIYERPGLWRILGVLLMCYFPILGLMTFIQLMAVRAKHRFFRFRYLLLVFCLVIVPLTATYRHFNYDYSIKHEGTFEDVPKKAQFWNSFYVHIVYHHPIIHHVLYDHLNPFFKWILIVGKEARLAFSVKEKLGQEWEKVIYKNQPVYKHMDRLDGIYTSSGIILFLAVEALQIFKIKDRGKDHPEAATEGVLQLAERNLVYMQMTLNKNHYYKIFMPFGVYLLLGSVEIPFMLMADDQINRKFKNVAFEKLNQLLNGVEKSLSAAKLSKAKKQEYQDRIKKLRRSWFKLEAHTKGHQSP